MKIIFVITGLGEGGAEAMLLKLLSQINKSKFECVVLSLQDEGKHGKVVASLGIPIFFLNMKASRISLGSLISYLKIVKKNKPDIIQGWMYHANIFSSFAKIFFPTVPIIFNVRHSFCKSLDKPLTKFMIKVNAIFSYMAKAVINNSLASQNQHYDIGFCRKNSVYIPNGFNFELFKPDSDIYENFRRSYHFDSNIKIIGNLSRFHPMENHFGLLDIFYKIKFLSSDANLVFVLGGTGVDVNNKQLMEKINELDLKDNCILLGSVKTCQIMPAFDVYLSASWGEGFPNVLGEAMACGVPCVVTDVGDSRDIVSVFGSVASPGEYDLLARYCIAKLDVSVEEKVKIRQHVIDNYPIEKIVKKYENLYEQILA